LATLGQNNGSLYYENGSITAPQTEDQMAKGRANLALGAALLVATFGSSAAQRAAAAACDPAARVANLNFTLKDLNGKDVSLSAYKGKVILLDFWATWCGPCKIEIPGFIELYSKYRAKGLQVVGFSVDEPVSTVKPYVEQMKMNYPVLVGQGREDVLEAFGPLIGMPTTFIIGRDGRICKTHAGYTTKDTFEEGIKGLL
jgi:cytochrome c biogenesis protein CcmG/thiol:disulfide interchange protein DsbE